MDQAVKVNPENLDLRNQEMKLEALRALKELIHSPGWAFLRVHLERLCRQKEKAKSECLRSERDRTAARLQGEIDGISLWTRELEHQIELLNEPEKSEE